jgi:mono/diheme cytochrome c family protein
MTGPLGLIAAVLFASTPLAAEEADTPSAVAYEFFEEKVRPLLSERCSGCHGPEKQEAGLRLDSRDSILRGGDSGPAALSGNAADSLLLEAIEHRSLEMPPPPKKKLTDDEIGLLRNWIDTGMAWSPLAVAPKSELEKTWDTHWAFQPINDPTPPSTKLTEWIQTPVDRFVLARLETAGHSPSPKADRETLIRRAFYDLIGLPPTYEEITAFVNDSSASAFASVIDDLLSRKEYGQRWGRHWLDVARYADTKGPIDGGEQRYAFAHTYRDYVINAFNKDLSYDRFILEQIAADKLDLGNHDRALAAMGFLTLGNKYYERVHEMVDDRIDVVSRGLMGLTMGCARCHTHKYDPIPTADYYSWYGVFRSSVEPYYFDKPILNEPRNADSPQWDAYMTDYREKEKELKEYRQKQLAEITYEMRAFAADYLEYIAEEDPNHRSVTQFARKTDRTWLRGPTLHGEGSTTHWKAYIYSRSENDPVFGIWHRLAALSKEDLPLQFEETLRGHHETHPRIREALLNHPPKKLADVARAIGGVLEDIYAAWQEMKEKHPHTAQFHDPLLEELRQVIYGTESPCVMTVEESRDCYRIGEHDNIRELQGAFEKVFFDHAAVAPERALVMVDNPKLYEPYIFVRGNPKSKGQDVPRRFLHMMSPIDGGRPFENGSGRLRMAQGIVHPENPLTARVIVNRIWGWHFGKELVGTPSDFGTRSLSPTHPDLLDYLATRFRRSGWSIKSLHRLIMLSATYQQASDGRPELLEKDPENNLLWRVNPQRLDFESFRDYLLAVSENLDTSLGGLSTKDLFSSRRSAYLFIDRRRLSSVYSMFDFPDPDLSTPKRVTTITPQQALFVMNHPLLLEASENVVDGILAQTPSGDKEKRINLVYRRVHGRDASQEEIAQAMQYLETESASQDVGHAHINPGAEHWSYGYGTYDGDTERVVDFAPFPHFSGRAYLESEQEPGADPNSLQLTRDGGHPGTDADHSVIRRLHIPHDGTLRIFGDLRHSGSCGDGIEARIVSSASGELGSWIVTKTEISTRVGGRREGSAVKVKAGGTLDFVVSCRESNDCDAFEWAPVVSLRSGGEDDPKRFSFVAHEDFTGPGGTMPPLTPWVKLAHAMLQSNEFMFVN